MGVRLAEGAEGLEDGGASAGDEVSPTHWRSSATC